MSQGPAIRCAVVFVIAASLRLPFLGWPLIEDEGAYAYVARRWLAGSSLYGPDLWLDRPQAIFLAYMPPVVLGGAPWLIRAWGALWAAATAVAVVRVAERLGSAPAGLIAGLTFAVLSVSPFVEGWTANSEWFMLLPATAAFEMLLRRRAGWAGALTAAAVLLKPSAAPMILLAPWFLRRRSELARWITGAVVVTVPIALHGWWTAGLDGYVHALVGARLSAWQSLDVPHPHPVGSTLLTSPAWLGLLIAGAPVLCRCRGVLAWLAVSAVGVVIGGQYYAHYYLQLIPPLAVATGLALSARVSRPAVVAAIWAVALTLAAVSHPAAWWEDRDMVAPDVAAYVKRESRQDDAIYVAFSAASILYLSERRSADRYFYPLHVMSVGGARDRLVGRLRAAEPAYVVYADRMVRRRPSPWRVFDDDAFDTALERNYELVTRVATVPIYRRKTAAVVATP